MKTITQLRNLQSIAMNVPKAWQWLKGTAIIFLLPFSLPAQIIYQGPNNGVIFENIPINNSSAVWTSVQNAQYPDGILTTSGPLSSSGDFTDYLQATQFFFTIPSNNTISGIEVVITRGSTRLPQTLDYRVQIVKNGVMDSYNHSNSTPWKAQSNPATYGGNGDLWGETWSPADINSSGFGIAIAVKRQGGGQSLTAFIDNIQIKIYYYDSGGNTYYSGTSGASLRTVSLKGTVIQEHPPVFSVFPNPSDGTSFSIRFEEPPQSNVLVVLYDILGREEYAKITINANSSFIDIIECNKKLAPGLYLVTATNRDNIHKQIIIVK